MTAPAASPRPPPRTTRPRRSPTPGPTPPPFYAIGAGVALIVVGAAGYLLSEKASPVTALIPAVLGALLIVCGLVARTGRRP